MMSDAERAWRGLEPAWRAAMRAAWASACAGSLGIGAVITDDTGEVVATGRNRIMETDPGDDHLAGSTLAHAETNALAKLRWRAHDGDRLTLWSTLEPCLMCAGAIRMAPIAEVRYLTPDPLFDGIQSMRHLNEFIARSWPTVVGPRTDPFGPLGLVLPAHCFLFWGVPVVEGWRQGLPATIALAEELAASGELADAAAAGLAIDQVADRLWDRLAAAAADLAGPA